MTTTRRIASTETVTILIEIDESQIGQELYEPGISATGAREELRDLVAAIQELPETAVDGVSVAIATFSKQLISRFRDVFGADQPAVTIEYGVRIAGELGIKIVSVSGEATFKVKVKWTG